MGKKYFQKILFEKTNEKNIFKNVITILGKTNVDL